MRFDAAVNQAIHKYAGRVVNKNLSDVKTYEALDMALNATVSVKELDTLNTLKWLKKNGDLLISEIFLTIESASEDKVAGHGKDLKDDFVSDLVLRHMYDSNTIVGVEDPTRVEFDRYMTEVVFPELRSIGLEVFQKKDDEDDYSGQDAFYSTAKKAIRI